MILLPSAMIHLSVFAARGQKRLFFFVMSLIIQPENFRKKKNTFVDFQALLDQHFFSLSIYLYLQMLTIYN